MTLFLSKIGNPRSTDVAAVATTLNIAIDHIKELENKVEDLTRKLAAVGKG